MNTSLTFSLPHHPQPVTVTRAHVEDVARNSQSFDEPPARLLESLGTLGRYTLHSTRCGELWAVKDEVLGLLYWTLIMSPQSDTFALLCATFPRSLVLKWSKFLGVSTLEDRFASLVRVELKSRGVQPLTDRECDRLRRIAIANGEELDAIGRVLVQSRKGQDRESYRRQLTEAEEAAHVLARKTTTSRDTSG